MISSIIWNTLLLMGFSSLHVILKFKPFISLVTPAISASVHYSILLNSYNGLIALCSNFLPFPLPTLLLLHPFSGFLISSKNMALLATRLLHVFPFLRSFTNLNKGLKNYIQIRTLILENQKGNIFFWCTYVI